MRALKTICCAAALAAFLAPAAHADEWNKKTFLTFSGPVQLPAVTLKAGTYVFELANPDTTRHVIRISEKDTNKNIGLFMTIPNERMQPPDDNLIMFSERPAGSPPAVQAWFYPGDRIGEEFVYPKQQAMQIAKATKRGVLATEAGGVANTSDVVGRSVTRVDESGREVKEEPRATTAPATTARAETTPRADTTPRGEMPPSTTAPRATTAPRQSATGTSGATRRELPRTASNLPMLQLASGLAIAGALAVRRLRKRAVTA